MTFSAADSDRQRRWVRQLGDLRMSEFMGLLAGSFQSSDDELRAKHLSNFISLILPSEVVNHF